jgi:hypothetical protein
MDSEQLTVDSYPYLTRERIEKWKFFSFSPEKESPYTLNEQLSIVNCQLSTNKTTVLLKQLPIADRCEHYGK